MALKRDELGFIRSSGYGRIQRDELEQLLGIGPHEGVYRSGIEQGVRTGQVIEDREVALHRAIPSLSDLGLLRALHQRPYRQLKREVDALCRVGFGGIGVPAFSHEG